MRGSAVLIAGAVRTAYAHASGISKPLRLVIDLTDGQVILEESSSLLDHREERSHRRRRGGDRGRARSPSKRRRASSRARARRARRSRRRRPSASTAGEGQTGKTLASGVRFVQIETGHDRRAPDDGPLVHLLLARRPDGARRHPAHDRGKGRGADREELDDGPRRPPHRQDRDQEEASSRCSAPATKKRNPSATTTVSDRPGGARSSSNRSPNSRHEDL
jgi:hypothetical protein